MVKRYRVLFFIFLLFLPLTGFSQDKGGTTKEIKTPRTRLRETERRITHQKRKLSEARRREREILKRLNLLNKEIYKTEANLGRIRDQLSRIERDSKRIEEEIIVSKMELAKKRERLTKRLRVMYKLRRLGHLEAILTATDFADFIKRAHFIGLIAREDAELIRLAKEKVEAIEAKKKALLDKKKELETLKKKEAAEKAAYEIQRRSRKRVLAKIKESERVYLSRIKELEKASKEIKRLIGRLESKKRDIVGLSKEILRLKSHLPWPVEGKVIRGFGPYIHPKFKTMVNNKGIDIKATYGQIVRSVLEGKVVFADYFKGYGRLAMIDHGGGLYSLYAYLSDILIKKGDLVKTGAPIGKVGEGENPGEGCLHFELRANGEPINPIEWLKNRRR